MANSANPEINKKIATSALGTLIIATVFFYLGDRYAETLVTYPGQIFDHLSDAFLSMWQTIKDAPFALDMTSNSLLFGGACFLIIWMIWLRYVAFIGNYRSGEESGSARWGTVKEGKKFKDLQTEDNNLLFTKNFGLALHRPKFDPEYDRNLNVLVVGGSGSGKTFNYVTPNICQLNTSYFVTDPKGTLLKDAGYLFTDNGYKLKSFNTINLDESMHYNPLKYVKTDTDILSFVNCFIMNTNPEGKSSGDPFWENAEKMLYTALIALLRDWFPAKDYNMSSLLTLLSLAEARENDENFKSALDLMFLQIEEGKKYKQNEPRITFQDIEDCLVLVINSFSTQTSYENQTKKAITNTFIYSAMNAFLREQLEIYFMEHPAEAEVFTGRILNNKRSRESAESQKNLMRRKFNTVVDMSNRVEKFVNCRTKDVARRELYIVEGDSAMTSVKLARDPEFQAVIPVRGKTLNCLKADYNRISKSDIISDLIRVIGCGVEITGSKRKDDASDFNLANLRWSKIILCTDADEDGFQIRTLLLTLFYRLLPTLLKEGKVFIAETPLFEITTKSKTYFAYDEFEKAEILKQLGNTRYTLQRSKGLGENQADMMWETTMNPETRRLIRITPDEAAATSEMFDLLLGDNLSGRKEYIAEHGADYLELADIS